MELLQIWDVILRRKWIIILVSLLFFLLVCLGTQLITPSYEAKALVLVKQTDSLESLLSNLGLSTLQAGGGAITGQTEEYETEIALATLRPLLEKLVDRLNLKDHRGDALKAHKITSGKLKKRIFSEPYIEVDQVEDSDLLEIVSSASSAEEAANISNVLAELYIEDSLSRTRDEFKNIRIFIESKISIVKEEYYRSLTNIQDFMIREKIADLSSETQYLIDKIGSLKTQYEDNERDLLVIEKTQNEIVKELKDRKQFRKDSEVFSRNEQREQLASKLNDLRLDIAARAAELRQEHPDYKQIEEEIKIAKTLLAAEASLILDNEKFSVDPVYDELAQRLVANDIDRTASLAKRNLYQAVIDEYQEALLRIPVKLTENQKLDMALSVKKTTYTKLLEYLSNVGIAESMTLSDIQIVESAVAPEEQNFPNKMINYVLGAFFGLFWGFFCAFLREYVDNTIRRPDDLKRFGRLAYLGSVPRSRALAKKRIISGLGPASDAAEAFRSIKNAVLYATRDRPMRSMVVTSSVDSEGKSLIAANLAIVFAVSRYRVLAVDSNLRRPSLARFYGISADKGLTKLLAGKSTLEDSIIPTDVQGLDVLPSGPVPSDPGRLIESGEVREILKSLEQRFDVILIDTPSIMSASDALVIGRIADGMLLVVRSSRVAFGTLERAEELLERAGINLIGTVMNG